RHLAKIEGAARAAGTSTDHDHAGLRGPDVAVLDTTQRLGKLGQAMASAGQDPHPLLTPFMGGKRLPARFVRHDVLQTQLGNGNGPRGTGCATPRMAGRQGPPKACVWSATGCGAAS